MAANLIRNNADWETIPELHFSSGAVVWLIRYQVIENELERFRAHCFEESTLETPFAQEPKKKTILSGLKLLLHETG